MRYVLMMLVILIADPAVTPAAPVPKELKNSDFAGTWQINSVVIDGEEGLLADNPYWSINTKGQVIVHSELVPQESELTQTHIRLAFTVSSRSVDYINANEAIQSLAGVYEISGDTLKMSFDRNGGPRPKSAESGSGLLLWTFKRAPLPKAK